MIQYVVAVAVGALFGSMDKSKPKKRKKFEDGGKTGDKPKVESLTEFFMLMDGTYVAYEDMGDAKKMFGGDPLTPQELVDKLAFEGIFVMDYAPELFDLPDGDDEGDVKDGVTIDDIEYAIEDLLKADNSYNYSAPFVFDVRFNETRDAYDPQVMIVREHRGGDVRGNYGPAMAFELENMESNPFYGRMSIEIETNKGRISLDAESLEGYNFYVSRDETGTFEDDSTIDRDEIEEALDFGSVKSETLYINDFAHGGVVGEKLSPAEMQKLILDKTGELLDPDTQKFANVAGAMGYAYALFGGYWTKSFAKGGNVSSEEIMRRKQVEKVAERSIRKMDSDDQLSSLREYAQRDIDQKFGGGNFDLGDKALKKAYEDKATFDLPTPRYYIPKFAHGGMTDEAMRIQNFHIYEVKRTGKWNWVDLDDGRTRGGYPSKKDAHEGLKEYRSMKRRIASDPLRSKVLNFRGELAHGGKTHRQGYDDKLDESLSMRHGAGRKKQQTRKDRRDESAAMERSMGRRKYASVGTMDKGRRTMEKGGKTGRETITYNVYNIDGNVIRSAESIADFDKGTITLPNGKKFKVKPDLDFTMKFQKTQIKAKDGLEGLVRNMKEFSSPDSAFNLLYADKFAPKEMEKGGTTKKPRKKVSDFDKLAMKVAARYRAEGKSNEEAMEIGRGTAAKVYRQQQGKKGK